MANITFSADEKQIKEARLQAASQNTTLNQLFRDWLKQQANRRQKVEDLKKFLDKGPYFTSKRKLTREEMNER